MEFGKISFVFEDQAAGVIGSSIPPSIRASVLNDCEKGFFKGVLSGVQIAQIS